MSGFVFLLGFTGCFVKLDSILGRLIEIRWMEGGMHVRLDDMILYSPSIRPEDFSLPLVARLPLIVRTP
ncbi:MAG TPA: hypothetical protein VJI74_03100 [Candidatus Paceibacterota bacterium]